MSERQIALSARLRMLACMVTPGNRAADVGCDHGFLSIYLVQAGISPRVIATDVREGPLKAAREHIHSWEMGAYIETRLSDGLCGLRPGEVETIVCAGMGGPLMERILTEGKDLAGGVRELILQPQSEIPEFRSFLRRAGFQVTDEEMVCDGGKYYVAMRAVPDGEWSDSPGEDMGRYDRFGEKLLQKRHPVLEQYLHWQENVVKRLTQELSDNCTDRARQRLQEVCSELEDIRWALKFFEREG